MSNTSRYILVNNSSEKAIEVAKSIKQEINFIPLQYSKIASFTNGLALEYSTSEFFISIEVDSEGEIYILYKLLFKYSKGKKVLRKNLYRFLKRLLNLLDII